MVYRDGSTKSAAQSNLGNAAPSCVAHSAVSSAHSTALTCIDAEIKIVLFCFKFCSAMVSLLGAHAKVCWFTNLHPFECSSIFVSSLRNCVRQDPAQFTQLKDGVTYTYGDHWELRVRGQGKIEVTNDYQELMMRVRR